MAIKINVDKLKKAATAAFRDTMLQLGVEYTKTISDPNAFPDFSGQDLVDTGRLRASQQLQFVEEGKAEFSWTTDYSLYVHEGYTKKNGKKQAGRPWTKVGMKRLDINESFRQNLAKNL